ncbi:hypothetical protein [Streptomyces virginiae]|uniref:hypothetical protein n=1 Tax=Streptomyces virginiae TaxID=1961 RepID=UPI00225B768D|nr:hypothetical protein [Streptomyces virginiae]MCX5276830.1 hypothetical protein [Streptomyces virginiae]
MPIEDRDRQGGSSERPQPGTAQEKQKSWRDFFFTLPGQALTTIVVGLATWAVTHFTGVLDTWFKDEGPWVKVAVQTNPYRVGSFNNNAIYGAMPIGARPATGPRTGCDGFHDWLLKHGGTDAPQSNLQVVVQGNADGEVQISNLRVLITGRQEPSRTVGVVCPSAGEANPRPISIDLDKASPRAVYTSSSGRPFGFTVKQGETETFPITATAHAAHYSWRLEFDMTWGTETSTQLVDDHGKPFRTAPRPAGPSWVWDFQNAWTAPGTAVTSPPQRLSVGEEFHIPQRSDRRTG